VPIFIDRLPMREVLASYAGRTLRTCYPLLPGILTEPGEEEAPLDQCRPWKVDTGNALGAVTWRFHLEQAGLDPEHNLLPHSVSILSANSAAETLPIRRANLWLVSNIPSLRSRPLRLSLGIGFPFYNRPHPNPRDRYPLLGVAALRRAGVRLQMDFARLTLSVWVRGSCLQGGDYAGLHGAPRLSKMPGARSEGVK
jgi:hypothetical protein